MIRVLLLEDHASFRNSLAFMLGREPDIDVVAQAGTLAEARGMLEGVDVAVFDLQLPDGDSIKLVRELRAVNRGVAILLLTASAGRLDAARAVEAGVDGVMHKAAGVSEVIDAVRRLAAGEQLLAQGEIIDLLRLAAQKREQDWAAVAALQRLTPRERQVLEAVAEGLPDKEIAQRLHIGHETVRTHVVNVIGKLGVDSRLQALLLAARHGFITLV